MSALASFESACFYGQVTIQRTPEDVFPEWTEAHVPQGFSLSRNAVSFGLPEHDGSLWIEIDLEDTEPVLSKEAIRAIDVPFVTEKTGAVFRSAEGDIVVDLPVGSYRARFSLLPGRAVNGNWMTYVLHLQFISDDAPKAAILRGDDEVSAGAALILEAA